MGYNLSMISATLPTYAVVIIIAVIAVQYAFALFCLLKLAYLDISKKEYVLWNLFILLVFFIGGAAFLVYWFKVKDTKRIQPYTPEVKEETASEDVIENTSAPTEDEKPKEPQEQDKTE